jgi:tetratricopeptide (TPR) repeat protein
LASPPDAETLVQQSRVLAETDPAAAEQLLRQAVVQTDGRDSTAAIALCRLTALRGRWDEALVLFRNLNLRNCPDEFLLDFGRRAYEAGHIAESLAALSELRVRKSAASVHALDTLFFIYREHGDDPAMVDCLREMAVLENNRPELWWKLLELLDRRNMTTDAIQTLRQALARQIPSHDQSEMRHQLVSRLVDQGAAAEARAELDVLAAQEPRSPRVKLHEAALFRLEGKPQLALQAMDAAFAAGSPARGTLHLRALIYFDLQRYREAATDLETEIAENPYDLVAHFKLADAYRRLGEFDLAARHQQISKGIRDKRQRINLLREFSLQHPEDRDACAELARLCRELNDLEQAAWWEQRADDLALRPGGVR